MAYPGIFFGGGQKIQLRTERTGIWGRSPLVRGSGGSCNFGTRNFISYSKIFLIFGTLRLFMMTTNLFVIANVKQLRTYVVSEFYCLFSAHLGVLASYIQQFLTVFTNRAEFGTILEGLWNFGGGG